MLNVLHCKITSTDNQKANLMTNSQVSHRIVLGLCTATVATLSHLAVAPAQAATLTHQYGLNNTLADSFGGSSLVANGGTLVASGGYSFAANQGPSLSNAIDSSDYSIALDFSFSNVSGYRKIIDFKNLTSDNGLYTNNGNLDFYPIAGGSYTINPDTLAKVVLTRDGVTGQTTGYVNGAQQFTFTDSGSIATFDAASSIINFLQDDTVTSRREASGGFLQDISIYKGALSASEVTGLSTAVPEPFTIIGTLIGGTAAIRMRKKLKASAN